VRYIVTVAGRAIEVDVDGDQVTVEGRTRTAVLRSAPGGLMRQLLVDGRPRALSMRSPARGQWTVNAAGDRWEAEVIDERTRHIRSLTVGAGQARGPASLRAPMPGLVVRVLVEPEQEVAAGAGLVVLEAMKMENELKATAGGVVSAVLAQPGAAVEKGQVLVEFRAP
jgi:pyruvate carboxylase subunit B